MTPAALASVVTNSRAKVAAGDADYLDVAVVALADARDDALDRLETEQIECTVARQLLNAERVDLDAAVALLRDFSEGIDCDVIQFGREGECSLASEGGCWAHRRLAFLASRPEKELP